MSGPALETPAQRVWRRVVGAALIVLLGVALFHLQGLFDQGDRRRAVDLVAHHQARPGTPTFGSWLQDTYGAPEWSATILSGCRGIVRVVAKTPQGLHLAFDVDLIKKTFEASNTPAREALARWEAALSPAPDTPASRPAGAAAGSAPPPAPMPTPPAAAAAPAGEHAP
ncbi:MAG: hypothetical protein D6729_11970 [Deltaproteobacteria bacterium]|nr:MAG: hypothetical protein D6729_11970 [Deltaproteobacteria bacterium]